MNEHTDNLFEAIMHDLAEHLGFDMLMGGWSDLQEKTDTNFLEEKTEFEKHCALFVKERIPKDDPHTLEDARITVIRKDGIADIEIYIIVDGKKYLGTNEVRI